MQSIKTAAGALVLAAMISVCWASSASAFTFEVSTKAKEGKVEAAAGGTRWVDGKLTMACAKAALSGSLKEGAAVAGSELGEISNASWNEGAETCESEGAIKFVYKVETAAGEHPWRVSASRQANDGRIDVVVHEFDVKIASGECKFEIKGRVPAVWDNEEQSLSFSAAINEAAEEQQWGSDELEVANVECPEVVKAGDKPYFEGTYTAASGSGVAVGEVTQEGEPAYTASTREGGGYFTATGGESLWTIGGSGMRVTCTEGSLGGLVKERVAALGSELVEVSKASFGTAGGICEGSGIIGEATVVASAPAAFWPWHITRAEGGTVEGTMEGVKVEVSSNSLLCKFEIEGGASFVWEDGSQSLAFGGEGTLAVSGVEMCLGEVEDGEEVRLEAVYDAPEGTELLIE